MGRGLIGNKGGTCSDWVFSFAEFASLATKIAENRLKDTSYSTTPTHEMPTTKFYLI
jgi:hypothetical protein